MIYAGCDLGIVSAKAAIVEDSDLLASEILPYKSFPDQAAVQVMDMALAKVGLSAKHVDHCVATGFGGKAVPHTDGVIPDIICLHRAVRQLNPRVRTVINVGGHTFMAFNITDNGTIGESAVTDKCAAGIGMLIDVMANALEMPLDELIRASADSRHPLYINNQCPIFVESEAISLINDGHDPFDIFAGIASSVATKIAGLVGRVNLNKEVVMVGGVAKNSIVVRNLEEKLGLSLANLDGVDPQIVGAFGAALMAKERCHT